MENLRGILLMVASMFCFAVEDAIVKSLKDIVPVSQIIAVLGVLGTLFFGILCWRKGVKLADQAFLSRPILIRSVCESVGTIAFVMAVTYTPLSLASAIFQMMPLLVTFGAALFLGEAVGWRRWSAIGVGFIGVLIIIRPGVEGFQPLSLLAVLAAVTLSGRDLVTRIIPKSLPSLLLAFWGFLVVVPTGLIIAPFDAPWVLPDPALALRLVAASAMGITGYYAITAAMRIGDVAVVTPFRYMRLLFGLSFGVLFFDETPDFWLYVGAVIVIGSGLYTLARETRLRPVSASR